MESFRRKLLVSGKSRRKDKCKDNESNIPQVITDPTCMTPIVSESTSGLDEEGKQDSYRKYGLNSPPQGKYAQDLQQAERRMKQDGFGKYLKKFKSGSEETRDKTKCLVFLYGRGFFVTSKQKHRKMFVIDILEKPSAMVRLKRLLDSEGADRDLTACKKCLYLQLSRTLRCYFQQNGSFGFLPNGGNDAVKYYFRIQKQGNCFMHSPCVMMPYLFLSRGIETCYPVDLSKFVRRVFNDEQLYKYIVKDNGGSSLEVLRTILGSLFKIGPQIDTYNYGTVIKKEFDLPGKLKMFGPGLVTGFRCNKHFINKTTNSETGKPGYIQFQGGHCSRGRFVQLSSPGDDEIYENEVEISLAAYLSAHDFNSTYLTSPQELFQISGMNSVTVDTHKNRKFMGGTVDDKETGRDGATAKEESHSMLLIGGRIYKGRLWLLLQNWWEDMQLVEVDAEYFAGSQAMLSFVCHETEEFVGVDLNSIFSTNDSLVADSNNLDRADYAAHDGCFPPSQLDRC